MALLRRVASRSGVLARWLRYPNPFQAPWRRPVVDVGRRAAIGDVLMCTPALRELKRRRPAARIRFYTDFASLVRGLLYIDEVLPSEAAPENLLLLRYESVTPPRAHLARIIGDCLGLSVRDVRPDCAIDRALVERFRAAWRELPRPHLVISRRASSWTPNKDWPDKYWRELIERLVQVATVIEIGSPADSATKYLCSNYIDLRGCTSLDEFVAVVAAGDVHIGPVSGPVHIAAAAGIRSVVIVSGYEDPANTAYPGNIALYTRVECAPCWLREPCPHKLKCLNAITPRQVEEAILSLWHEASRGHRAAPLQRSVLENQVGGQLPTR
jgi:ADP-heptose:LPS heptosyltransferase